MQPGLLKKGQGRPRRHFPEEPAAQPTCSGSGVGSLVLQQCFPGRARQAGFQRRTRHGQAASSGTRHSSHHPPGPSHQVPKPNALAFTRSSGTAGPRDGAQSCSHTSSVNQHLGDCDPRGRLPLPARPHGTTGAAAGRAEVPRTRLLPSDRPRTDAGVGRPGLGPRSLSRSKSRHRKIAQDGQRRKKREQQRCRRRGGQQKASVRTWASRTPNRAQSCSQGVARGGGGRFLVLLRMVYGRGRESQEERRRNSPV